MKKYFAVLLLLLCLLALSTTVSAVQPETIRFKSANPVISFDPCDEPVGLGITPIGAYYETMDLLSPKAQPNDPPIGMAYMCHFVENVVETGQVETQYNVTYTTYEFFSVGEVYTRSRVQLMFLPNGKVGAQIDGEVVGGSGAFDGASGTEMAVGKVVFSQDGSPEPNIQFFLRLR